MKTQLTRQVDCGLHLQSQNSTLSNQCRIFLHLATLFGGNILVASPSEILHGILNISCFCSGTNFILKFSSQALDKRQSKGKQMLFKTQENTSPVLMGWEEEFWEHIDIATVVVLPLLLLY